MPGQDKSTKNYWVPAFVMALAVGGVVLWFLVRWSNYGPWVVPPAAKSLTNPEAANAAGGHDNVSVQLIQVRAVERMGLYRGRPYRLL